MGPFTNLPLFRLDSHFDFESDCEFVRPSSAILPSSLCQSAWSCQQTPQLYSKLESLSPCSEPMRLFVEVCRSLYPAGSLTPIVCIWFFLHSNMSGSRLLKARLQLFAQVCNLVNTSQVIAAFSCLLKHFMLESELLSHCSLIKQLYASWEVIIS